VTDDAIGTTIGFRHEDIRPDESTRSAKLKWVVIVDSELPSGFAVNAAVCVAAATSANVSGLLGPDGHDQAGTVHQGLPWAGCSILAADPGQLADIRSRALASEGVFVADMPDHAQRNRVYDDYLAQLALTAAEDIKYCAVSVLGPRNRIDKLVKKLPLLT
jgi:hypothetical protein